MPARITPSAGKKPDKLITDALKLELHALARDSGGVMTKKLRLIARRLIDRGIEGDVPAIREFMDRVEGKVPTTVTDTDGANLVVRVVKFAEMLDEAAVIPDTATDSIH